MEPGGSLPRPQEPVTGPNPEPDGSGSQTHTVFIQDHMDIILSRLTYYRYFKSK